VILVDSDVLIANLSGIDSAHTWLLYGLPLATLNVKHFPMFDGLCVPFQIP